MSVDPSSPHDRSPRDPIAAPASAPSRRARARSDAAFRWVLLAALAAGIYLVHPFLDALTAAAVVTVLAWPVRERLCARLPGHPVLVAAAVSALCVAGTLVPAFLVLAVVGRHLADLLQRAASSEGWGEGARRLGEHPWLARRVDGDALADLVPAALHEVAAMVARSVTGSVPGLLSLTAGAALHVTVFVIALATLFYRGGDLLSWALRVSPLETRHTSRLFAVFAEFARNVVLAGLVTGLLQGVVAGIGYSLAGVESAGLFAVVTAVLAYVPIVGTALVWAPLSIVLLAGGQAGGAAFLVAWSLLVTTSIDNVVKPLLVRGTSHVPTLLVFLGVFGGLRWFGLVGVLVGPVLVAMILALLRFHEEMAAEEGEAADA